MTLNIPTPKTMLYKPILNDEELRKLKEVLEEALGKTFRKEFMNQFPEELTYKTKLKDIYEDIEEAANDAVWNFTIAFSSQLSLFFISLFISFGSINLH